MTERRNSTPIQEGKMSTEQVIEQVHLHRDAVRGRIVVIAFDDKPDGPKAVRLGDDGTIAGEYPVEVGKLADGRFAIEVESINAVGWEKVEWLIERVRECEAKAAQADEIIAADGDGDLDIEEWKERLRAEGEARFMEKARAILDGGGGA